MYAMNTNPDDGMHLTQRYLFKSMEKKTQFIDMVGWLCLTSHRQRGHLETAPPFTVPREGREAR